MTRAELRSELQNRGFDGFLTTDLDRYINWGYFDLARRLRLPIMDVAPSFTLNQGQYRQAMATLSPPIKSVRRIIITTDGSEQMLTGMAEEEFWKSYAPQGFVDPSNVMSSTWTTTAPEWYYVYQGYIIILPACAAQTVFTVESWQQVTAMTSDSDVHLIPEDSEELLLTAILRICHTRANEPDLAGQKLAELEIKIKDVQDDEAFTQEDLPERTVKEEWGINY
jgi:hypothetical protein